MATRDAAAKAWNDLLYLGYVILRILLRLLIGKDRRSWVQDVLGLHYSRIHAVTLKIFSQDYAVKYGGIYGYEPEFRRVIRAVLKRGKTFIDVGAFKGLYTFYAYGLLRKKSGFKIIAVEPFPNNYRILEGKIDNKNIHLVKEAVWTRDGEIVEFHVTGLSSDGSSLYGRVSLTKSRAENFDPSGKTLHVKTVRLDSLIKKFKLKHVDLVKMDIEGAEYEILTDPTLDLSNIYNILVEVHYKYESKEFRGIIQSLAKHGFKIVPINISKSDRHHLLAYRGEIPW